MRTMSKTEISQLEKGMEAILSPKYVKRDTEPESSQSVRVVEATKSHICLVSTAGEVFMRRKQDCVGYLLTTALSEPEDMIKALLARVGKLETQVLALLPQVPKKGNGAIVEHPAL